MPLGRIVYTRQALPAVELVNFTLDDGDIIIRTDSSGKLAAATRGAVVAFEADNVDAIAHAGWSVTIVGYSRAVTDGADIRHLEDAASSWAPGEDDHFIRISPEIVNGRGSPPSRRQEPHEASITWTAAGGIVLGALPARPPCSQRQLRHALAGAGRARRHRSPGTSCSR